MSQKKIIIEEVNKLIKTRDYISIEKAEVIFNNYLKENPKDIDMWVRFTVLEIQPLLCDYEKILECVNEILKLDQHNFEAIMLFACLNHFFAPDYDMEVLKKLSEIMTSDPEKLSMVEYAKSWSYSRVEEDKYRKLYGNVDGFYNRPENYKQYENALKESINLYSHHVLNYQDLAYLYSKTNRKHESVNLLKAAIANVKLVYKKDDVFQEDWTSVQGYFDECVKGIHRSKCLYESLINDLKEYSQP